jgi:hypothetical protein
MKKTARFLQLALLGGLIFSANAATDSYYEVTVTNLTKGITFRPAVVATTQWGETFFEAGSSASVELETIAESGNSAPLAGSLDSYDSVSLDFIGPGQSGSVVVAARGRYGSISLASMLSPTNDTFFALNSVQLPNGNQMMTIYVPAWDAGTELNDELCANLAAPNFNGDPGPASDNGEGYIYVSNGIRGVGDLDADQMDFNNPVARITITRQ